MADLPKEISLFILSNLPVKSLLRFKCVSKSWCSWISCPKFELSNQQRQGVLATVYTRTTTTPIIQRPTFRFVNQQLTLEEINYPTSDDDTFIGSCMLLGSCNGLILVSLNEYIYLWNPATRSRTKVLKFDYLQSGYSTHGGLCYDSYKNAYKAVLIMPYRTSFTDEFVTVANLADKQWRPLEFPYNIRSLSYEINITLHGRLHFWLRAENNSELIYFDPISERFHMFPVPEPKYNEEENVIVGVGVLNECLCMTRLDDDKGGVEILVMKEYGVKESWTSLFFIRNLEISSSYGFAAPFSMTDTGEVALIIDHYDKKVVVYNPKIDNMRDILVVERTEFTCGAMVTYLESLISPEEY